LSQSPSTPRREVLLLAGDLLGGVGARLRLDFLHGRPLPNCFSIWISIGMPWQSQPGT
jgi:hypothetical protein